MQKPEADKIAVLMYHRIGQIRADDERRYCISPKRFAEHMRHLAAKGMQACSVDDFVGWLYDGKTLPEGSFLLTFDDGFMGVYDHAAPVLEDLGWPATVFLVSGLLGREDEWNRSKSAGGFTYPLMNAEHIANLRDRGFTFHSHTRSHMNLCGATDEELVAQLQGSRQDLAELLGAPPDYLAYPYGRYDERVIEAVRAAGYKAAFSVHSGFNARHADRYRIRRLDVFGTDTAATLARKIALGSNEGGLGSMLVYYADRLIARARGK